MEKKSVKLLNKTIHLMTVMLRRELVNETGRRTQNGAKYWRQKRAPPEGLER
jgi:hypothetical protein